MRCVSASPDGSPPLVPALPLAGSQASAPRPAHLSDPAPVCGLLSSGAVESGLLCASLAKLSSHKRGLLMPGV